VKVLKYTVFNFIEDKILAPYRSFFNIILRLCVSQIKAFKKIKKRKDLMVSDFY